MTATITNTNQWLVVLVDCGIPRFHLYDNDWKFMADRKPDRPLPVLIGEDGRMDLSFSEPIVDIIGQSFPGFDLIPYGDPKVCFSANTIVLATYRLFARKNELVPPRGILTVGALRGFIEGLDGNVHVLVDDDDAEWVNIAHLYKPTHDENGDETPDSTHTAVSFMRGEPYDTRQF